MISVPQVIRAFKKLATVVVVIILTTTAMLKISSLVGHYSSLQRPNAMFGFLSESSLLQLATVAELAIVALILVSKNDLLVFSSVAWLATMFAFYRYGISLLGEPCNCSGVPLNAWYSSPQVLTAELIALAACGWGGLCACILPSMKFAVPKSV